MLARRTISLLSMLLILGGCLTGGQAGGRADQPPQRFEFRWLAMGVGASIVMYATDEQTAREAARAAQARIETIESVLSDYRVQSEVSRLPDRMNADPRPLAIDPILADAAVLSQRLRARTGSAFDERLGELTSLWRSARREGRPPDPASARAVWRHSRTDYTIRPGDPPTIDAPSPIHFDFGGIGKGLAADEAARVLQQRRVSRFLVDLGGDLVLGEPPPGAAGWRVSIDALGDETIHVELAGCAIATSGPDYQSLASEGVEYSHIVDPRRGEPVTAARAVTVIASDGATADALASALSVLGADGAEEIQREFPAIRWRIIERSAGGELREASSPNFGAAPAPERPQPAR